MTPSPFRSRTCCRFVALAILLSFFEQAAAFGDVAVIVHKDNPVSDISSRDLIKIFRQERQNWESGQRVYFILREASAPEMRVVLIKIYRMENNEDLKTFWLSRIFREESAAFPQILTSNEAVRRFVSRVPNAVGFVDASFGDDQVKVLQIDGKLPGQTSYFLAD